MKYLVICTEYEYNDEYYHTTEDESYKVSSKLFSTKEEAEKKAEELNKKHGWKGYVYTDNGPYGIEEEMIKPYSVLEVEE